VNISLQQIAADHKASGPGLEEGARRAEKLLQMLSLLDGDNISYDWIVRVLIRLFQRVPQSAEEIKEMFAPFRSLLQYSLVQADSNYSRFTIHRLTQQIMIDREGADKLIKEYGSMIVEYLIADAADDREGPKKQEERQVAQLTHVEKLLCFRSYLSKIDQARLHKLQADVLFYIFSKPSAAILLYENILTAYSDEHYNPKGLEVAYVLHSLGYGHGELGDVRKKLELLRRVYDIYTEQLGENHPSIAAVLGGLGGCYHALGKAQRSKDTFEAALAIKEHHYGADHYEVAVTLVNLAAVYGSLGNPHKQKELLERALAIQEHHYGADHYKVAVTLGNLAVAHGSLGNPHKKKELLERAFAIEVHHYGADHYQVAVTLGNLAIAFGLLGNPHKQKELLERALTIQEHHYWR